MSHRHITRQPDVRLHDPSSTVHSNSFPHLNGNTTPSNHNTLVSPSAMPSSVPNGTGPNSSIHKLAYSNEQTWLLIGRIAEQMGDLDHAQTAYEHSLRHNPTSLSGLTQVAGIARIKENYPMAVEYFQRVIRLQDDNGEVWSALGHCYLMQDDLQMAYSAYQQALYKLPNPKEDPKLWYGIGILYDRYGSLDHAEEAFASVLRMDKDFDKANEILFRLGIIYKQQGKYEDSLTCFDRILRNPPSPLAHADIWFQIGHVYEQQKDHVRAKDAYERVVADNPGHAKVLQQLGWLYHQDGSSFQNQDLAIQYLTKSLEADPSDAQSWYLLGRAYMAGQKYNKAYEAYQQAVYRDGRNPTFWCSIGVLYFQINQFRDALDAYSRAIRINPYISEVWFDLGSLYESCNNQISDAIDAYARASELDPGNPDISRRLDLLKTAQATGSQLPAAPGPQDVHPTAYANTLVTAPGLSGPPLMLQPGHHRPVFRTDSRGPGVDGGLPLPPPSQVAISRSSPGPFRGGPPPPVILDESRHLPSHTPLAPMEVDRPPHGRDYPSARDSHNRGPIGHQSLLLHHPVPQQQLPEDIRGGPNHQESYFARPRSVSPPSYPSRASPPPQLQNYPHGSRLPVGPGQPSSALSQRSPRVYAHDVGRPGPVDPEMHWDRRAPPPGDHQREWDRERRRRHGGDYPGHSSQTQHAYPRSPEPHHRAHSPPEHSPRSTHAPRGYWESKPPGPAQHHVRGPSPPPVHHEHHGRRYDPRYDARDPREYDREHMQDPRHEPRSYAGSPESSRNHLPQHLVPATARISTSPRPMPAPEPKERRRRTAKDKEVDTAPAASQEPPPKKERRKRTSKRVKEEAHAEGSKPFIVERPPQLPGPGTFAVQYGLQKGRSPEPVSASGSGSSNRSAQPSPSSAAARPPSRVVDEDYDEGVADSLMALASYKAPERPAQPPSANLAQSPTISPGPRPTVTSPRPPISHRGSISSSRSHVSPPPGSSTSAGSASLKRPLTPGLDDMPDNKRSRVDEFKRRVSSESGGRRTPVPSLRPSPIPFRTQPSSHSPEARHLVETIRHSPPLPILPPHPRPVGVTGLSSQNNASGDSGSVNLPPIATLSPTSTAPSPGGQEEQMQVDRSRSTSPPSHSKLTNVLNPAPHTSHSPEAQPSS